MVELTGCSVVHKSETREASNAAGVQQSSALGIGVVGWDLRRVEREEGGDVSGAQYIRRDGGREVWSLCTSLPQSLLTDQCGWELGGREGNTHCDDTVRDWLAKRCLCDLFEVRHEHRHHLLRGEGLRLVAIGNLEVRKERGIMSLHK